MLKKKTITILSLCLAVTILQQCTKTNTATVAALTILATPTLPTSPFNYVITYPAHVQAALIANDNVTTDNPITNDGATLGRVLFYDKNLSKNNTISCGSCHKQAQSFDDDTVLSKGFDGGFTTRNSMAILNIRFYKSGKMFWDERSISVEKQALVPIQNHVEMGLTLAELETKVAAQLYYPSLFQKAFGSTTIDSVKITKALSQFERSIVTYQSKYDLVKQGLANFTSQESQGEQTFLNAGATTCAACHAPPMFLTSSPVKSFAILDPTDLGINNQNRFKAGSIRNIAMRKFLFHNGSVANIQDMLTGTPNPIPSHTVPAPDVQNLLAFLTTLNDATILTEEKFSNPFK